MTKIVFFYWLVVLTPILVFAAFLRGQLRVRSLAIAISLIIVPTLIVIYQWRPQQYSELLSFRSDDGRANSLSGIKKEYATMNWREYAAGYVYFTPYIGPSLTKDWFDEATANKFDRAHQDSFFQSFLAKGSTNSEPSPDSRLSEVAMIPLFTYRGMFVGGCCSAAGNTLLPYPESTSPLINILPRDIIYVAFALFSLLLIPGLLLFSFWAIVSRNFGIILFCLPALYSFGIYSVASHNIPRYSQPLASVTIVIMVVAVWVLIRKSIFNKAGQTSEGPMWA